MSWMGSSYFMLPQSGCQPEIYRFNLLSADTYYYGIIPTNGSFQNQIVSYQKFTASK